MTDAEKRCREVYDARRRHVMGDFPEYDADDIPELLDDIDRLRGLPERLMAVEVGRAGWEGNEDIITVSGKPVGCTYTREAAHAIAGAWSWLLREVLKEADDE